MAITGRRKREIKDMPASSWQRLLAREVWERQIPKALMTGVDFERYSHKCSIKDLTSSTTKRRHARSRGVFEILFEAIIGSN